MSQTCLNNVRVLHPDGEIRTGGLHFDDRVRGVLSEGSALPLGAQVVDGEGALVTPGLIDLHTHGIGPYAYERSVEDLRNGLALLPQYGVTTVLPTLYRVLGRDSLPHLQKLSDALDDVPVHVTGFHLEGPFLAITGAGALTMEGDVGFLDELLAACRGRVAAVSVSPEVPGILPVIERLVEREIAVFITHTRASAEQTQAAIDAGARHATHFYDVFPVPQETEPGVRPVGAVEVILGDPRTTVDFICDGIHVHPAAIRAALAAKGPDGVVAITDSNLGAGMPAGVYDTPWGYRIRVSPTDAARIDDDGHPDRGGLSGSSLTLNRAVANLSTWLPGHPTLAWLMATRNAARVINLSHRGRIFETAVADLVQWNPDGTPRRTWVGGRLAFESAR